MTVASTDRSFPTFSRGDYRNDILTFFRTGLRLMTNPATGLPFTETEIATATSELTRYWREADAIDLVLLSGDERALHLADQIRPKRANTEMLKGYHAELWGEDYLPASGGSGKGNAPATVGTTFVGSTTVPDLAAHYATDPAGLRYQVLYTVVTPGSGMAALTFQGIDTGDETNIVTGTKLKWASGPLGATDDVTTTEDFTGGTDVETDAEFADRLSDRIRHKPGSGNNAHFRGWGRESTNAVEDCFVYACALHAGSVIVCVLQKRAGVPGPFGRVASVSTLAAVTAYLTPPSSPVVPAFPYMLVTTAQIELSNMVLLLSMPKGQSNGWTDLQPWPVVASAAATITAVADTTHFTITLPIGSSAALPSGVTAPSLMQWNVNDSRWEKLIVVSVTANGGSPPTFSVTLSAPPAFALTNGTHISPDTPLRESLALGIEAYFDTLGPGEVVNLTSDSRAHRAVRFPPPSEEYPQRAGSSIVGVLQEYLGSSLSDASLASISLATPSLPTDPTLGPRLLVAGDMGVYPQ